MDDGTFPVLLKTLNDSSEEVRYAFGWLELFVYDLVLGHQK